MLSNRIDQDVSLNVAGELAEHFGKTFVSQPTHDEIPTFWIASPMAHSVLDYLRTGITHPYRTLFDLTAIDERQRFHRQDQPASCQIASNCDPSFACKNDPLASGAEQAAEGPARAA